MKNVILPDHPLIQHKLTLLRDKNTGTKEFKELVSEISSMLCYEATRDLPLKEVEIETPVAVAKCKVISGKKLAVVPILRAGLGMMDGVLSLIPAAKVGHIGIYREENTMQAVQYYCKLPADIEERETLVLEPTLATGNSADAALTLIREHTKKPIRYLCILAAPEGLERIAQRHPDVQIYCAAVDERLDDNGFILPGVGDCGDRIFGTK